MKDIMKCRLLDKIKILEVCSMIIPLVSFIHLWTTFTWQYINVLHLKSHITYTYFIDDSKILSFLSVNFRLKIKLSLMKVTVHCLILTLCLWNIFSLNITTNILRGLLIWGFAFNTYKTENRIKSDWLSKYATCVWTTFFLARSCDTHIPMSMCNSVTHGIFMIIGQMEYLSGNYLIQKVNFFFHTHVLIYFLNVCLNKENKFWLHI